MVGRCSHCCNLMNNRVDVSDLEVGARIRVGDNDLATIKYIGEVSIINSNSIAFSSDNRTDVNNKAAMTHN